MVHNNVSFYGAATRQETSSSCRVMKSSSSGKRDLNIPASSDDGSTWLLHHVGMTALPRQVVSLSFGTPKSRASVVIPEFIRRLPEFLSGAGLLQFGCILRVAKTSTYTSLSGPRCCSRRPPRRWTQCRCSCRPGAAWRPAVPAPCCSLSRPSWSCAGRLGPGKGETTNKMGVGSN